MSGRSELHMAYDYWQEGPRDAACTERHCMRCEVFQAKHGMRLSLPYNSRHAEIIADFIHSDWFSESSGGRHIRRQRAHSPGAI